MKTWLNLIQVVNVPIVDMYASNTKIPVKTKHVAKRKYGKRISKLPSTIVLKTGRRVSTFLMCKERGHLHVERHRVVVTEDV